MTHETTPYNLIPIAAEEVPADVASFIHEKSDNNPTRLAVIGAFRNIFRYDGADIMTYIAERERVVDDGEGDSRQSTMHVVSVKDGEIAGHTHILKVHEGPEVEYIGDKPYVAWTETKDDYRRQGLGEQRYEVANAATTLIHGEPLHSDGEVMREPEDTRLWEKLVKAGKAESYTTSLGDTDFRFKQ